jgi:hypothetical protein
VNGLLTGSEKEAEVEANEIEGKIFVVSARMPNFALNLICGISSIVVKQDMRNNATQKTFLLFP